MEKPKYYKCINIEGGEANFTLNKIYKIINSDNLESSCNFIDDKGKKDGWGGENYKHFIPTTKKEYFIQEGIIIPIFNYNKLINILKFIDNYGKN